MNEQRLIDANAIKQKVKNSTAIRSVKAGILVFVDCAPTIDPETLPIVQELRKELERVTRERDAAVSEIESIIAYGLHLPNTCPFCKNEQCKMRGGTEPCIPKWRGIQEVQEDE